MIRADSEKLVRSHPGAVLLGILEDIGVSQRRFAAHIGVTPA
jgi:hypothetical protein